MIPLMYTSTVLYTDQYELLSALLKLPVGKKKQSMSRPVRVRRPQPPGVRIFQPPGFVVCDTSYIRRNVSQSLQRSVTRGTEIFEEGSEGKGLSIVWPWAGTLIKMDGREFNSPGPNNSHQLPDPTLSAPPPPSIEEMVK